MKANGSDRWKANRCVYTSLGGETSEKQEKFARVCLKAFDLQQI